MAAALKRRILVGRYYLDLVQQYTAGTLTREEFDRLVKAPPAGPSTNAGKGDPDRKTLAAGG